ncbi:hypothetical protein SKM56_08860 [Acinetobacter faecalis]|nr:hypothetical protein [Acinetobacter faecalis]MDY6484919.1 hypothetical protein [Acinetobacter faecalis]
MMTSSQIDAISATPVARKSLVKTKENQSTLLYRLMILYRFIVALLGGYVLSSLSAILIAEAFSEDRGSAAMGATIVAFLIWTAAFIWVFMVNKTLKASLGIILPSLVLFVIYKLLGN